MGASSSCPEDICCKGQPPDKKEPCFSEILAGEEVDQVINTEPKVYSWDKQPRRDPAEYTIADLKDGEQKVKVPGEVNGQQLIVRNCNNANIYVLDHIGQLTIDDCSDCLIVLGPVKGSIFLRDTKNSTLVASGQQLRLRDCQFIHLFVGIESDPIIEASTNVIVAPYFLSYKGIKDHFNSANISRFKATHWSEIYDFTPNDVTPNWRRYSRGKHNPQNFICPPQPPEEYSDLGMSVDEEFTSIPITSHIDDVQLEGWRKFDVTFTQEHPEKEQEILDQLMDKFYKEKFIKEGSILVEIKCEKYRYTWKYFQR